MALEYPPALGPGVREAVGRAELVEIGRDAGIVLLRPSPPQALLVLHQRPPDTTAALDEADRLAWLTGRGPAPEVLAAGRADEGDEAIVVHHGAEAVPAALGHPMGPEALAHGLAAALRSLHELDVGACPFEADTAQLRRLVDARIAHGEVMVASDGPYAGRAPDELAELFDDLVGSLPGAGPPVFIHAGLAAQRVWFDPGGAVTFTGWRHAGVGDRHCDLAAAAALVTALHGPALVAPLFEAYGMDDVDLRCLDAHQLLVHLLA